MAPVRLGSWSGHRPAPDLPVLRLAGLKSVPGALPTWDKSLGTVLACVDNTLRRVGGAPTYLLTDNERTLTSDRIAGVPVRHLV